MTLPTKIDPSRFYQGKPKLDLVGRVFGSLTVESYYGSSKTKWTSYWNCRCVCGKVCISNRDNLLSSRTASCGCLKANFRHPNWKGCGRLSYSHWGRLLVAAASRGLPVEITIEQAWNLYLSQKGLCALSGLEIDFGFRNKDETTASLDRIDSTLGYSIDNVQWLHKQVNIMKMDLDQFRLVELCRLIVFHKGG